MKKTLLLILALAACMSGQAQTRWFNPFDEGAETHGQGWSELRKGYTRLPAKAEKTVRPSVWSLSRNAAGLSLAFISDAGEIDVRYGVKGRHAMFHMPATGTSGVDLYAIDRDGRTRWCAPHFTPSFRDTINYSYDNLTYFPEGATEYEYHLYLPLYNTINWLEIGVPEGSKVEFLPVSDHRPVVVYGTSIAQGACASRAGMAWTNIVEREMRLPVINLAFSGNGRLEGELFDLLNEIEAGVYIIDCLPNVSANIDSLVTAGVTRLREGHDCPILLVEHSGYTNEYTNESRSYYRKSNAELKATYDRLVSEGVEQLHYLSSEEIGFGIDCMVEGVHPNDIGMRRQADAVISKLKAIMPEPVHEVLYNGIELPEIWPPRYPLPAKMQEMPLPYVENKPDPIIINVGRQLFVDDFLIESTDMERVCHRARMYEGNPILVGDKEWDTTKNGATCAIPFSGGAWFDETDGKFKMWYTGGNYEIDGKSVHTTSYAESTDGKAWTKPDLGVYGHTNIIDTVDCDSRSVWLNKQEKDPAKRFMTVYVSTYDNCKYELKYSPDGYHWSDVVRRAGDRIQDRSTVIWNPFRNKWIGSLRIVKKFDKNLRSRGYYEDDSIERIVERSHWVQDELDYARDSCIGNYTMVDRDVVFWFSADDKDPRHPFPDIAKEYEPAIYNFDATAYESVMLGQYAVWRGPENHECRDRKINKLNEFCVGFSRDGFHYARPDHLAFMGTVQEEGAWNWGNMQPAIGNPCIVGDSLYFYCGGRANHHDENWDSWSQTGLGILRRDGFVSMKSMNGEGTLTTSKLSFDGKYFFINAEAEAVAVELLDAEGNPVPGFTKDECIVLKDINSTKAMVCWKGSGSLKKYAGKTMRFKFYVTDGEIYSFWVSPWKTGESRGYLGGGGPGLNPTGVDVPFKK